MTGSLVIAGLGPGLAALVTPEVTAALAEATDVVGYIPYVARVAARPGLTLHPSDNRVEIERATLALQLAKSGQRVVVVSSGDPGVFAMASAVFEAAEARPEFADVDIRVLPGGLNGYSGGDGVFCGVILGLLPAIVWPVYVVCCVSVLLGV